MIKNIIFDVGMVLVDFACRKVFQELNFSKEEMEAVAAATIQSNLWDEYDRSEKSDEEILQMMIEQAPEQEKNIRLFWEHIGETIICYPYSHAWIAELKEKGYGCYILSNYPRRTYELTKKELSFQELVDGALFSYQVHQVKPEPEIYQTLLNKYQLKPEECVFLDDNPKNIHAAERLGIHGIVFTTREEALKKLSLLGV